MTISNALSPMLQQLRPQTTQLQKQTTPYTPEQRFQDIFSWNREQLKRKMMEDEQGVAQLKQTLQGYKAMPQSIDLKPLMAGMQTGVAKQYLESVPDVETPEQRVQKIAAIENLIQQRSGDLTENQLKLLGQELAKRSVEEQSRNLRFTERQNLQKENTLRGEINKNITDSAISDEQKFSMMDDALAKGDYQSTLNTLSVYARAVSGEKGVLTDNDISRVMPANLNMTWAKLVSYFSNTPTAEIDPAISAKMRELIDLAKEKAAQKYEKLLQSKQQVYGSPKSSYSNIMGPGSVGEDIFKSGKNAVESLKPKKALPATPMQQAPGQMQTAPQGQMAVPQAEQDRAKQILADRKKAKKGQP